MNQAQVAVPTEEQIASLVKHTLELQAKISEYLSAAETAIEHQHDYLKNIHLKGSSDSFIGALFGYLVVVPIVLYVMDRKDWRKVDACAPGIIVLGNLLKHCVKGTQFVSHPLWQEVNQSLDTFLELVRPGQAKFVSFGDFFIKKGRFFQIRPDVLVKTKRFYALRPDLSEKLFNFLLTRSGRMENYKGLDNIRQIEEDLVKLMATLEAWKEMRVSARQPATS